MKNLPIYPGGPSPAIRFARHVALCALVMAVGISRADTLNDLLGEYTSAGAGPFSASAGEMLWHRKILSAEGPARACTSCHNADLRQPGRHATTGKDIEPLAPSVNAERLTDKRKIEKWFLRNCKWTLGRECSAQEKGDLLSFLATQ